MSLTHISRPFSSFRLLPLPHSSCFFDQSHCSKKKKKSLPTQRKTRDCVSLSPQSECVSGVWEQTEHFFANFSDYWIQWFLIRTGDFCRWINKNRRTPFLPLMHFSLHPSPALQFCECYLMWLICQPSSQFFTFHLLSPAIVPTKPGRGHCFPTHSRVWRDRNLTEQSRGTCRCSFSSLLRDSCQGLFIPALFLMSFPQWP